jgi:hypothetical protein
VRHLNNINSDDRWANLKEVEPVVNRKAANKYPGVHWKVRKSQYEVRFYTNGKQTLLGCFDDFKEAVKCKKEADANRKSSNVRTNESLVTDTSVEFDCKYDKWKATARVNGRKLYLGLFPTRDCAIEAQIEAEEKDNMLY